MKKSLKRTIATVLATTMMFPTAISVNAVAHLPGCGASGDVKQCGTYQMTISGSHNLHTNVICDTQGYMYSHYYICSNPACGVQTRTGSYEVCTRTHRYCPTETGLCR